MTQLCVFFLYFRHDETVIHITIAIGVIKFVWKTESARWRDTGMSFNSNVSLLHTFLVGRLFVSAHCMSFGIK